MNDPARTQYEAVLESFQRDLDAVKNKLVDPSQTLLSFFRAILTFVVKLHTMLPAHFEAAISASRLSLSCISKPLHVGNGFRSAHIPMISLDLVG